MKERRQYFRIDDTVQLKYRVIQDVDIEAEIRHSHYEQNNLTELRNAYNVIDTRLLVLMEKLHKKIPLIAETLSLINKKLSLMERMISHKEDLDESMYPVHEVNLSANGMAFDTHTPIAENTNLKIELVLYPECHYIPLYAKVVDCRKKIEDSLHRFVIATEFVGICNEDQDKIIQHILKKQMNDLKHNHEEQSPMEEDLPKASVGY